MLMAKTALGRWVGVDDWEAQREDAALRILYGYRVVGGARAEVGAAAFANALGLDPAEAVELGDRLVAQGRAFRGMGAHAYRLSPAGLAEVQSLIGGAGA